MLYIAFCVPQIGVGVQNILVYLKSGSGSKMIIRRKMNTYSFLTVGVPITTTITITTAVFPRVQKEEIQHGGRSAHGQELRRPTTLCCGKKYQKEIKQEMKK